MKAPALVIFLMVLVVVFYIIDESGGMSGGSLTPSNAAEIGATGRVQVVELYADWCSACRASAGDVKAVEADFEGQADFIYLDVDDSSNRQILATKFNRSNAIPTFYLLAPDGTILNHWVGMPGKSRLSSEINAAVDRFPAGTSTSGIEQVLSAIKGGVRVANSVRQ